MTDPLSEEKIRSQLPVRADCEFHLVMLRGATKHRHLKQVRASYGRFFAFGDSERKAFRLLKESIRDELRNGQQMEFADII